MQCYGIKPCTEKSFFFFLMLRGTALELLEKKKTHKKQWRFVLLYLANVTEHRSVMEEAESSLVWVTKIFFGKKLGILFESRSDKLVEHLVVQTIVGRKPRPQPSSDLCIFLRGRSRGLFYY